ncbi:DUF805 domain-containing protein [Pasteurella oralis]|uniref:DUF805 domain-containing protein n=1 Tax=Pasteurella oralis TaxID=1071947 RepID=A0ABW4NSD5_9PAST|nr:DUF805 domain-containing protein [Pasteurella oralis]
MNWYFHVLKNYVTFSGRAGRKEFWMFTLIQFIIIVLLFIVDINNGTYNSDVEMGLLSGIYILLTFLPTLAVTARRLHDMNHSAWWLLLNLIPIGQIALLALCCAKSTPGTNRFGPNPKEIDMNNESKNDTTLIS